MTSFEKIILKELRELKELLAVDDMVNEERAADILGVKVNTMRIYASQGKLDGLFDLNALGKRMYYKSRLVRKSI